MVRLDYPFSCRLLATGDRQNLLLYRMVELPAKKWERLSDMLVTAWEDADSRRNASPSISEQARVIEGKNYAIERRATLHKS